MGIKLLDTAKPVKILKPVNEEFISIKDHDKEIVKSFNDLTRKELDRYYDEMDTDVVLHHKEFKGLNIVELYDVKDTTMKKQDYESEPLPALFYSSYDEIYNSFVKALYSDGYKVKYEEMENKFSIDKENKTISLKKGLNKHIHLLSILDAYTTDVSSNDMEKNLLDFVICRRIGIDKKTIDYDDFYKWYDNQDIKNVDRLLKLVINKGRKFANNFNKFYEKELEQNKELYSYDDKGLYDDFLPPL